MLNYVCCCTLSLLHSLQKLLIVNLPIRILIALQNDVIHIATNRKIRLLKYPLDLLLRNLATLVLIEFLEDVLQVLFGLHEG